MNKLLVKDSNVSINNSYQNLEIKTSKLILNISGSNTINDYDNNTDLDLKIIMEPHSKLLYNRKNANINNFTLDIEALSDSYIEFNYSLETSVASNIKLDANINGNQNTSRINFHGVTNDEGLINIIATSKVSENTKDNEILENLRIIALNDTENEIVPNLLVRSDSVNAIHNTTISSIDKDYLFYLNSKGIDNETATKLIVDGFLKSVLKENIK